MFGMKTISVYLLSVHLLLALVLWKSNFIEMVETKLGVVSSESSDFYQSMVSFHQRMDGSIPDGAVLFIGDSITQSLATSAVSKLSVNYGIGSDTSVGVLERLPFYQSVERSKAVVLAIGNNDIDIGISPAETVHNVKAILDSMPNHVPVIISAVLPVGTVAQGLGTADQDAAYINSVFTALNSGLEKLSETYQQVTYIDVSTKLTDDAGYLRSNYHVGDGVHLNSAGYHIFIDELSAALSALPAH